MEFTYQFEYKKETYQKEKIVHDNTAYSWKMTDFFVFLSSISQRLTWKKHNDKALIFRSYEE